jgi:hypothetical protein
MAYNFTLKTARVGIDPGASYGYWDRKDGSEGGGLWFSHGKALQDFDGAHLVPRAVVEQIRTLGYTVSEDFY